MDAGCFLGGILALLELIEEHPAEAARDFREKLHCSIKDLGLSVRWDEALLLVQTLMRDPSSWLHAAVAGWEYPISRETVALMDLYDLQHASKSKRKPRPIPRPWPDKRQKLGGRARNTRRTSTELRAILRPQS